jgi:nicotinamidase-related amidase
MNKARRTRALLLVACRPDQTCALGFSTYTGLVASLGGSAGASGSTTWPAAAPPNACIAVIHVQHVMHANGAAPFFNAGTPGADIHPQVLAAAPDAPVVTKQFADSFEETTLGDQLASQGIDALLLCGMMTQHCVTYTALSQ